MICGFFIYDLWILYIMICGFFIYDLWILYFSSQNNMVSSKENQRDTVHCIKLNFPNDSNKT